MIGKDGVITVLDVRGDRVGIGASAPREVEVHREEVVHALEQADKGAAPPDPAALQARCRMRPGRSRRSALLCAPAAAAGPEASPGGWCAVSGRGPVHCARTAEAA